MRLQSWRGSQPLSPTPRRSFPWARLILVLIAIGIAAYLFVPNYYYVRSDALVKGDLVPVAPLFRARVDKLYVSCADRVKAGQTLALVSNYLDQANFQHQYLQSMEQVQLAQVGLDERIAAGQSNAASLREAYRSAQLTARRLQDQFNSYDAAYAQGAVAKVDWQMRRTEWKSAEATAESERLAWQRAEQAIVRLKLDANQRIASSQSLAQQSADLANRVSSEALTAPVSGYIVDCIQRPQNVIQPGLPLFEIFQPDRAYALAYVAPDQMQYISVGQQLSVRITGINRDLKGRVISIYPDMVALPSQLTRFFWQHVQWAQYRPVRIVLEDLKPSERGNLYYDAQARISLNIRRSPFEKISER